MKMMRKKSALSAMLALVAGLLVVPAYAQNDPKAAAKAAKEAAAKAKEEAKKAAIEKAKAEAQAAAEKKAEKNVKAVKAKNEAAAAEAEAASKAAAEQHAKYEGMIERLDQIATATNNAELQAVVARLKEKEAKRHGLAAPAAAATK